jgi:hypothetical protein
LLVLAFAFDVISFHGLSTMTMNAVSGDVALERAVQARDPRHLPERDGRVRSLQEEPRSPEEALMSWVRSVSPRLDQTTEDFLQRGTCVNRYFTPLASAGVRPLLHRLVAASTAIDGEEAHRALGQILGCDSAPARLMERAVFVTTERELAQALDQVSKAPATVVLRRSAAAHAPPESQIEAGTGAAGSGSVTVSRIEPDRVVLAVDVPGAQGNWLVYADAFHSDWRAEVDGESVEIAEAYGAFKAVRVGQGRHIVELAFRSGVARFSMPIAVVACSLALLAIAFLLVAAWRPSLVSMGVKPLA